MKNFKKFISMLLVLVMTVALAACGGSEPAGEEAGTSDVKAACVLGIGGLGDQGYNDLIYAGMEKQNWVSNLTMQNPNRLQTSNRSCATCLMQVNTK